ncbi:divergent CRAL/TRIO domain-containing protein [Phyllosticta citricarpa]|uniref:Divergent CRAL/TRIO domain-containing protein n=2 Tax=Phyllosticta TaxID=121621 RepID=A0ABR1MRJ7_9PEZI
MRAQLAQRATRLRSSSLSAIPPPRNSVDYDPELAKNAASILYRSPIPSQSGLAVYILNAAALPDTDEVDFDALLPYVLARLPGEEELLSGTEYEVIFFAGGDVERAGSKKNRPGWGWFIQAYHVLSRAMRKRLQKLYIVHERSWVRILVEMFSSIVSPKFRRKIVHVSTLTQLALHIPVENLLIPPSAYLHDRRLSPDIYVPYASGRRAFSVAQPFPMNAKGETRLPRVLRETTLFLLMDQNIKTEGLFRIPPHSRLKDVLKEAYDRGQKFIIWKDNGVTLPIPYYDNADNPEAVIKEVDVKDAYGVYMAAGLIKTWYAELRSPIFPQTSYRELRKLFGSPDDVPSLEQLIELISPKSEWSAIPAVARAILVRHLLPMLSTVTEHQKDNKMNAENLAVCFAPTLVCGPDQIEDAKMSTIVRRVLQEAIEMWENGLREACGIASGTFWLELRAPANPEEYEDPLEVTRKPRPQSEDFTVESPSEEDAGFADSERQCSGIILEDNDPPALPPRPSASSSHTPISPVGSDDTHFRRKPAPSVQVPPRYSSILAQEAGGAPVATSPVSHAATTDGFAPRNPFADDKDLEGQPGVKGLLPPIVPNHRSLTLEQSSLKPEPVIQAFPSLRKQQEAAVKQFDGKVRGPPGLADIIAAGPSDGITRKPLRSESGSSGSPLATSGLDTPLTTDSHSLSPNDVDFRRLDISTSPTTSASISHESLFDDARARNSSTQRTRSRSRGPNISSLARPVYQTAHPSAQPPGAPPARPLPANAAQDSIAKPLRVSEGLLRRMPSFQTPPPIPTDPVRKLDLKKKSVDDLRKLYEERTGSAKSLVEVGRERSRSTGAGVGMGRKG